MEGSERMSLRRVPSSHERLAEQYADSLAEYHERHRSLLAALWNDAVSMEDFEAMTEQIRADAIELKRARLELRMRRSQGNA